jgi:multiple sugar transport system ATP-binding protein
MNVMPSKAVPKVPLPETAVSLGIRPEHIALVAPGEGHLQGTVDVLEYLGADTFVIMACGDAGQVTVRVNGDIALEPGMKAGLRFQSEDLHAFDDTGLAIR